jgi:hypothetical protein
MHDKLDDDDRSTSDELGLEGTYVCAPAVISRLTLINYCRV